MKSKYPEYLDISGSRREYLRVTTIHGLRRVGWSKKRVAEILWLILFLISLIVFIYVMVTFIKDYQTYPVTTQVTRNYDYNTFPGVTICNQNVINRDKIKNTVEDFLSPFIQLRNMSEDIMKEAARSPYHEHRQLFASILSQMTFDDRKLKGHQLKDMVLHCAYEERECDVQERNSVNNKGDFIHVWNDIYGNCFTFAGGRARNENSDVEVRNVTKIGPQEGLILTLNTEGDQYLTALSPGEGIRLLIHPSTQMPFPDEEGISVAPKTQTNIALTLESYHRLGEPYSSCTGEDEITEYDYDYSAVACRKTCKQAAVLHECVCADPSLPLDYSVKDKICDLNNIYSTESVCYRQVENKLLEGTIDCDCPPPCREKKYSAALSTSYWPASSHNSTMNKMLYPVNGANRTYDYNHAVSIKVFFSEMGSTTIVEEAKYTMAEFMAQIGGVTTLFVGISIISFFEILELLCTFVLILCVPGMPPWQEDLIGQKFEDIETHQSPSKKNDMAKRMTDIDREASQINARPLPNSNKEKKIAISS